MGNPVGSDKLSLKINHSIISSYNAKLCSLLPIQGLWIIRYRVFINYCVFSLKFWNFSELCQFCCSAGVLPAWCVCTHTDTEGKQGKGKSPEYFKIFEKKHNIWIKSVNLTIYTKPLHICSRTFLQIFPKKYISQRCLSKVV